MVAKNPPMGWNSWDCYGAAVDEKTVRQNAEYMAANLKEYGWEYIVVDIQWSEPTANNHEYHPFTELCMDEYGRLIPAVNRFPSSTDGVGFTPLGEYIHSLGLKFGIHIMRGIPRQAVHLNTPVLGTTKKARDIAATASICEWNTDMYGVNCQADGAQEYYDSLFALYAEWGVDFVKVDDIARRYPETEREIEAIHKAIKHCGREMVLSLSPGPAAIETAEHLKQYANMWRITDDFWDKWELLYNMFDRAEVWCTHSGPGHWPDADMLPVGAILQDYDLKGWTKFTEDEQITMLSLWCMMRSPLMIGGEMTKNDKFTLWLLSNQELLDIEKNSHCAHQLFRRGEKGKEAIVWVAPHKEKGMYVALFNTDDKKKKIEVEMEELSLEGEYKVRDIWQQANCGVISQMTAENVSGKLSAEVESHGAKVFYLY